MIEIYTELLPHQKEAVEKLRKLKVGALFMEQGTGKSLTTMELARIRLEKGKIDHIIWLCPCSAKQNIRLEILRHCSPDFVRLFTICGIETLSTSISAISYLLQLTEDKRCFLVVDESLLVKTWKAKRSEHIRLIAEKCPYRIILNGTPISRNEVDLFGQFNILDWRILGYRSYYAFAANHIEYNDYGQISRVLNVDSLLQKISPYTYQIKKCECVKLPSKVYYTEPFSMTRQQDAHYEYVANKLLMQIDEMQPSTIYRLFSGLRAVLSGKRVIFDDEEHFHTEEFFSDPMNNPRIKTLLEILPDKEKAIIFCEYESEINQLCSILGEKAVRFDGQIPLKQRDKNLQKFRDEAQYLIANKQCAGYSLNLQFCHNVIYMSNDWNLGTRLQSEDRVHRYGQTESVNITDLCCEDSLDCAMLDCIARKQNLLNSIKRGLKNDVDLKDLIHGKRKQEGENIDETENLRKRQMNVKKGPALGRLHVQDLV